MSYKREEGQEPISYQALLNEIQDLKDENQHLRECLAESEELKKAEEALRESENRYRMLFTNMTEGFGLLEVIFDKKGNPYDYRYLEMNPAFELYLGVKRQQLLGKTIRETFPNLSPIAVEKYSELALSGQPINFEIFSQVANKYLDINAFIPEKGKVALILRDITERKKIEASLYEAYEKLQIQSEELQASNEELQAQSEELHAQTEELQVQSEELQAQTKELQDAYQTLSKSEESYRLLFTNMTEAFFLAEIIFDKDGKSYDYRFLEVNPAFELHTGLKREQILGRPVLEILSNPNITAIKNYGEVALSGQSMHFEVFSQATNRYLDIYAFSPEKRKIAAIFSDITERKQLENALKLSEQRLSNILSSIQDVFFELDYEWQFTFVNQSAARNGGLKPEELIGECIWEKFPYLVNSKFEEIYRQVMETRMPANFETKSLVNDQWYDVSVYPSESGISVFWTDITGRKMTEEALQESEEKYRSFFENSIDAVLLTSPDGTVYAANPAACRIFGMTEEELIRAGRNGTIDLSDPRLQPALEERARTGKFKGELKYRRKDGTIFPGEVSTAFFKDKNGAVKTTMIIRDITERKRAEEELQESEKLYRAIAKNFPNGTVYVFDHNLRYLVAEGEALECIGWNREQLEGKSVYDLDEETRKTIESRYRSVLAGQSFVFETPYRDRVMLSQYVPIRNDKGEIFAGLVVGLDITERKRVEEKLQQALMKAEEGDQLFAALMEYVPVGITIADASGRLRMVSRHGEKLLGGAHADKSVGEVVNQWAVYQPDGMTPMAIDDVPLVKAIQKGEVVRDIEILQLNTYGEKLFLLCNAAPIRDVEGNITGGIVAWSDITERKQLEEEIRQRAEELEMVMEVAPAIILIGHDPQSHNITGNRMTNEFYGAEVGENVSASVTNLRHYFREGCELTADELPMQEASRKDVDIRNAEYDVLFPSGECRSLLGSASPLHDAEGHVRGSVGAFVDITERKKAEDKLKYTLDNLDKLVKERTAELEKAYNWLKESEKGLAEAQRMAHIGNWDWTFVNNKLRWSDEMYSIFGLKPQEFEVTYITFLNYVHSDDRDYVDDAFKEAYNRKPLNIEFRIILANGEERIVYAKGEAVFDEKNNPVRIRGTTQDITERKKAEEALAKIEIARKQEIHHRIKNNLQVISSLLDLQAEQFRNKECIKDSEVLEAFRQSQDRVISMALIHEELYKGGGFETLNFEPYIQELAENLYQTYRLGNSDISLKLDLAENIFFDMDIAVPLGMIVNELVSNSLKHAFVGRDEGEIRIKLCREEYTEFESEDCERSNFVLTVSDNGVGIPESLDIEYLDSLGMQLVASLVDQLDGEFELKRNNGTEFTMRFKVKEDNSSKSVPAHS